MLPHKELVLETQQLHTQDYILVVQTLQVQVSDNQGQVQKYGLKKLIQVEDFNGDFVHQKVEVKLQRLHLMIQQIMLELEQQHQQNNYM